MNTSPFLREALELFDYTRNLRRDFHRHPELGFRETRTAEIVARELRSLGLEVMTGIAKTGVVGLMKGAHPGPALLMRFDMDALPVHEETGAEYASETPGVMHACGHDGHTAIGLTVARILHKHQDELAGAVKFMFQPAEEGMGGAEEMIKEGALENPRPNIALSMHLFNLQPLGWLGIGDGPVMAAADMFRVRVVGKGGHGALPHQAVDPVLASAQIISALQSIVARNISPLDTAVVSVTTVHAGDAFNVIPPEVQMQGTIRTFQPEIRKQVIDRFYRIVNGVADAMGCQVEIEVQNLTPALTNETHIAEKVRQIARQTLPESVIDVNYQTMASEDMAFVMQEIPGCFIFVGSANAAKGLDAVHHHPRFDFDEDALPRAAALMAAAAAAFLECR